MDDEELKTMTKDIVNAAIDLADGVHRLAQAMERFLEKVEDELDEPEE